jgi:glycosyltransferase involved in cell wall biosynthesis
MPKFSVIIPLYNKEGTIIRALNSVLNQKKQCFEIIIINDGSTDNSVRKVETIKDPRIKLFSQKNNGVSSARNFGIKMAKGEYIAFLDADDEWLPAFLFSIRDLINNYPHAIGYGTSYFKKYNNNLIKEIKLRHLQFDSNSGIINNYFKVCNYSDPPIWTSSVCIRKEDLLKIGGFSIGVKAGEDLLTWARLSQLGEFAFTKKPLAIYYQPEFNPLMEPPSTNDYVGTELKSMIETTKLELEKIELKKYLGNWHKMRASLFLITGQNKSLFFEVLQFIKYNGLTVKIIIYLSLIFVPVKLRYKILFPKI